MEIRSILVNVGLGEDHPALAYAVSLAQQFGATLSGVGAAEPRLIVAGAEGGQIAAEFYAAEQANIETLLTKAEAQFRQVAPAPGQVKWRGAVANTTDVLIDEASRCDLVITGSDESAIMSEALDVGHLILSCGRPVLVVGDGAEAFRVRKVVVAWKDTREARRAVSDAMPLLQRADQVKVVTLSEGELAAETASLEGIRAWLSLHGVQAETRLIANSGDFREQIGAVAVGDRPDLVVAGGYGHSRFREWLFGGVTRDLLETQGVNRLFSN